MNVKKILKKEVWVCPLCLTELRTETAKCENNLHYGKIYNRLTRKVEFDWRVKK